jgi:hypothetical protein
LAKFKHYTFILIPTWNFPQNRVKVLCDEISCREVKKNLKKEKRNVLSLHTRLLILKYYKTNPHSKRMTSQDLAYFKLFLTHNRSEVLSTTTGKCVSFHQIFHAWIFFLGAKLWHQAVMQPKVSLEQCTVIILHGGRLLKKI